MTITLPRTFRRCLILTAASCAVLISAASRIHAQNSLDHPALLPAATVNLATAHGAALMHGKWRYSETEVREADFAAAGGKLMKTHGYDPLVGATDFDDSKWEIISPASLGELRSFRGEISFHWYRINLTIPDKIGDFPTAGTTIVFQVTVDGDSEVWADGKPTREAGQGVAPFNHRFSAPNGLVIVTDAVPGRKIELAVCGFRQPSSDPPYNWSSLHGARLDFYTKPSAGDTH